MAAPERFEALILGSGAGGKLLAWHLARSGRRTAVVERQWVGGSCPNVNCMPSKNEIWSANVAYVARHAAEFGTTTGRVGIDMVRVRQRKRVMVDGQITGHLRNTRTAARSSAGGNRSTRDRLTPYCVFTDPPLAHVGLSEGDARRQGVTARVAKLPMREVLRVQTFGERPGFMKALISGSDDCILGFTMIGPEAGEVVAAVQAAMLAEMPYPKLRDAALVHLTMAEGLGPLLSKVPPLAYPSASVRARRRAVDLTQSFGKKPLV